VGDTVSDSGGARIAGIPFIYAKYGFGEDYKRGKTDDYDRAIVSLMELRRAVDDLIG
jgi:phosphoglycolate phosphatase-like HAD superfamily hydrolase